MYDIKKISDLTINSYWPLFKQTMNVKIEAILKRKNLTILEINEHEELKGICIYQDWHEFRLIHELCYTGENKYVFLKFVKFISNGDDWKYLHCNTSTFNHRINQFYYRLGFKIVKETDDILSLIYKR